MIVEGLPAGSARGGGDVAAELARRRLGYGRGPRMRFEADEVALVGGIRHGRTLGSPVAIEIGNTEWPKWDRGDVAEPGYPPRCSPSPGPDTPTWPGMLKYGFDDARDVLERASARETAARVAAGTLAKLVGCTVRRRRREPHRGPGRRRLPRPQPSVLGRAISKRSTRGAVRCFDPVRRKRR